MPDWKAVDVAHVLAAIEECDRLGDEEFLSRHHFGPARSYPLRHHDRAYDSKAILGVAHSYATGAAATPEELSSGEDAAAGTLRALGFEVDAAEGERPEAPPQATESARALWAVAARGCLVRTAQRYHAVTTHKELAERVQEETDVRTRQQVHYWIGDVLNRVAHDCASRGEPILSALCVNAHGSVGPAYAVAIQAVRGETPADPDDHAAQERLGCHRHFGADLPPGGGVAILTPKVAAVRDRARRTRIAERQPVMCPIHHLALSSSGTCDYCD